MLLGFYGFELSGSGAGRSGLRLTDVYGLYPLLVPRYSVNLGKEGKLVKFGSID